jgi:hypothetical protein
VCSGRVHAGTTADVKDAQLKLSETFGTATTFVDPFGVVDDDLAGQLNFVHRKAGLRAAGCVRSMEFKDQLLGTKRT